MIIVDTSNTGCKIYIMCRYKIYYSNSIIAGWLSVLIRSAVHVCKPPPPPVLPTSLFTADNALLSNLTLCVYVLICLPATTVVSGCYCVQ